MSLCFNTYLIVSFSFLKLLGDQQKRNLFLERSFLKILLAKGFFHSYRIPALKDSLFHLLPKKTIMIKEKITIRLLQQFEFAVLYFLENGYFPFLLYFFRYIPQMWNIVKKNDNDMFLCFLRNSRKYGLSNMVSTTRFSIFFVFPFKCCKISTSKCCFLFIYQILIFLIFTNLFG